MAVEASEFSTLSGRALATGNSCRSGRRPPCIADLPGRWRSCFRSFGSRLRSRRRGCWPLRRHRSRHIAALVATSSFAITCPRGSPSLVLASLIAALIANPVFAGNPRLVIGAAALCVFLAGVWQILFGLFRVAGIIKFTPHPVFAGFVNGAALLIIKAQIKPFFVDSASSSLALPSHPLVLAFVLLGALAIFHGSIVKNLGLSPALAKVPGTIVAFALGILVYHLAKWIEPTLDLGPTIGKPAINWRRRCSTPCSRPTPPSFGRSAGASCWFRWCSPW